MRRVGLWALAAVALCAPTARAQSGSDTGPESGNHEFQVWAAGGYTVHGGVSDTAVWNAGARCGWVLTDLHGPGFLSGRFEWALDAIPVFVVSGPTKTAYGASFDPAALRWNFRQRHSIMPYFELSGGVLFTDHAVPPGSNAVNFTPSTGIGISVPRGRLRWSAEVHFLHISNSSLANYNPGTNTLQLRAGFGWFRKRPY